MGPDGLFSLRRIGGSGTDIATAELSLRHSTTDADKDVNMGRMLTLWVGCKWGRREPKGVDTIRDVSEGFRKAHAAETAVLRGMTPMRSEKPMASKVQSVLHSASFSRTS